MSAEIEQPVAFGGERGCWDPQVCCGHALTVTAAGD
jgi:hypothetical protein